MKKIILATVLAACAASGAMASSVSGFPIDDYSVYYSNDLFETKSEIPFIKPDSGSILLSAMNHGTFNSSYTTNAMKHKDRQACVETAIKMKQLYPNTSFSCFNKTTQETTVLYE